MKSKDYQVQDQTRLESNRGQKESDQSWFKGYKAFEDLNSVQNHYRPIRRDSHGHPREVDTLLDGLTVRDKPILRTQILATVACSSIMLTCGASSGFTGITLPQMTNPNSSDIYLNPDQVSLFSSISSLGGLVGALVIGPLISVFGHKLVLLFTIPVSLICWIILSQTSHFGILLAIRVTHGVCYGMIVPCCMIYVSEISHHGVRGRLISSELAMMQLGFTFLYFVGSSGLNWRSVGLICGLSPGVVSFLIFLFLPNSPRWLGIKERFKDVHSSLTFFRGKDYNVTPELEAIREYVRSKGRHMSTLDQLRMLKEKSTIKTIIVVSLLILVSAFQGSRSVVSYTATIFQLAHTGFSEYLSSTISTLTQVLAACVISILIDKAGRKVLLIVSQGMAGLSMAVFSLFLYLQSLNYESTKISWMPLAALLSYNFFITNVAIISSVIQPELFSNSVRTMSVGIMSIIYEFSTFLVVFTFQYLVVGISLQWTFIYYGLNCILGAVVVHFLIPETKGKTLEEI